MANVVEILPDGRQGSLYSALNTMAADDLVTQQAKASATMSFTYHQVSNISGTLEGNKIVDHSDVVGASPVGAASTTSSFST